MCTQVVFSGKMMDSEDYALDDSLVSDSSQCSSSVSASSHQVRRPVIVRSKPMIVTDL